MARLELKPSCGSYPLFRGLTLIRPVNGSARAGRQSVSPSLCLPVCVVWNEVNVGGLGTITQNKIHQRWTASTVWYSVVKGGWGGVRAGKRSGSGWPGCLSDQRINVENRVKGGVCRSRSGQAPGNRGRHMGYRARAYSVQ
ncbi:hypothetical protein LZ31DRAFT_352491 [Colletotrichum somersetense]|nr:hypothetical protein LZ31DRAFT_352491 [Colletotrichum somersetense]